MRDNNFYFFRLWHVRNRRRFFGPTKRIDSAELTVSQTITSSKNLFHFFFLFVFD